jgi:hypothetical protein
MTGQFNSTIINIINPKWMTRVMAKHRQAGRQVSKGQGGRCDLLPLSLSLSLSLLASTTRRFDGITVFTVFTVIEDFISACVQEALRNEGTVSSCIDE